MSREAFDVVGRGVAVLTGIPCSLPCPVRIGDCLILKTPEGMVYEAQIGAIESALIRAPEECYGLMVRLVNAADLPTGTQVYLKGAMDDMTLQSTKLCAGLKTLFPREQGCSDYLMRWDERYRGRREVFCAGERGGGGVLGMLVRGRARWDPR